MTLHHVRIPDTMTALESAIATGLIATALGHGHSISVHDGEETALENSTDLADIHSALATTDHDILLFTPQGDEKPAFVVLLIWGNGADLINNYSDTPAGQEFFKLLNSVHVNFTDGEGQKTYHFATGEVTPYTTGTTEHTTGTTVTVTTEE